MKTVALRLWLWMQQHFLVKHTWGCIFYACGDVVFPSHGSQDQTLKTFLMSHKPSYKLRPGTIRENIQMGYNEYDDEQVLEICKVAGVDDFISSHPKDMTLK